MSIHRTITQKNSVLNSVDLTIKSVERLFNLFIGGDVSRTIKLSEQDGRRAIVSRIKDIIINAIKQTGEFLTVNSKFKKEL